MVAPPAIALTAKPGQVRVGIHRIRLRATVRASGRKKPLGRASVTFCGAQGAHGGHGCVTLRGRLGRPGRVQARASRAGYRTGSQTVRVVPAPPKKK